ncbi:MAG: hypothetical protein CMD28_01050 [Flavobacteriales bacterium]|nr:hypothetical protein [Flavobacteriales bacterium]
MIDSKTLILIENSIEEIDEKREIPEKLLSELISNNYFRLLLPKSLNGVEMDFIKYLEILFEIASKDASVAWCINQSNVLSTNAAFMEKDLAKKIFDDPNAIITNGPPLEYDIKENKSDTLVSGKWSFSSGIKHATWLLAIFTDEKKQNKNIMIPKSLAQLDDIWDVNGLRGTGSYSFSLKNKVPNENIFYDRLNLNEPGPLYKIPRDLKFGSGFSTIALSLANSSINFALDFAKNKKGGFAEKLSDEQVFLREIGIVKGLYKSSKSFLDNTIEKAWAVVSDGIFLEDELLADLRLSSTHAIRTSEEIVKKIYNLLGSSSIFKFNKVQRYFQDMLAISQQVQGRMYHFETIGDYYINSKLKKFI